MLIPVSDSNRIEKTPAITLLLISINSIIFLWFTFGSNLNYEISKYGMVPWEIINQRNIESPIAYKISSSMFQQEEIPVYRKINPFLSVLTSIFIHASFMHIAWNMLFLWVFGRSLENVMGSLLYLLFYLTGGFCASLIHFIFNFNSVIPVVGASGAVSAVMGAYLVKFPVARIKTLVFILFFITFVEIPSIVFLLIWFVFQFFADPEVAWLAHIGGFITGIFIIKKIDQIKFKKGEDDDQNFN